MDCIEQQIHEQCDTFGRLLKVDLVEDTWFGNTMGVKFTWECQKCHDTFVTTAPYFEALKMGGD